MFAEINNPRAFVLLFPPDVKFVYAVEKPFEYFKMCCKFSSCVNDLLQWIICLSCVGKFKIGIFPMSIIELKIENSCCSLPNSFLGLSAYLT
jgi:hypothetical protein